MNKYYNLKLSAKYVYIFPKKINEMVKSKG